MLNIGELIGIFADSADKEVDGKSSVGGGQLREFTVHTKLCCQAEQIGCTFLNDKLVDVFGEVRCIVGLLSCRVTCHEAAVADTCDHEVGLLEMRKVVNGTHSVKNVVGGSAIHGICVVRP